MYVASLLVNSFAVVSSLTCLFSRLSADGAAVQPPHIRQCRPTALTMDILPVSLVFAVVRSDVALVVCLYSQLFCAKIDSGL